jgi:hypothetical protein
MPVDLTRDQLAFLRRMARKTWHFFETFVTAEENWLPPDNFQEDPSPLVAARTSPTNIGLGLLANLAARDLGYISLGTLIARTQATIATVRRLERHHGHLYNWYNTRTLQPLFPLYVSSVDSGNLVGHLLTLGVGLRDLADEKVLPLQIFQGLRDTVGLLRHLDRTNPAFARLEADLEAIPSNLSAAYALLRKVATQSEQIATSFTNGEKDLQAWTQALARSCDDHLQELQSLVPQLTQLHSPKETLPNESPWLDGIPTLRQLSKWMKH